jgi:hypothetical protein
LWHAEILRIAPWTAVAGSDSRQRLNSQYFGTGRENASNRLLIIPELVNQIGPVNTAEFTRYLDTQQPSFEAQLKQRLALVRPQELQLASGQQNLRRYAFDVLTDVSGTRGFDPTPPGNPDAVGACDITGVSLPAGFLLQ